MQLPSNGNTCDNISAGDAHGNDIKLLTNGIVEITIVKPFDEFDSVSASDKMQFSASDMLPDPDMIIYIECLVAWVLTVLMVDESDHNS